MKMVMKMLIKEDFNNMMTAKVQDIEKILDDYLPKMAGFAQIITEAMEYSVKAGGKRIRPLLMKETFNIFGGNGDVIKPFMAAMEMLHTYSLVHDDLPAMDNDDYRRGRKTTHVVYGEAIGILAGDALLNYAYETAAGAFEYAKTKEDYSNISKALRVFMNKAGIYGMIGGQVVDVMNDGKPITVEMLDFIFRLKTGALLEASLMIGAILAGADEAQVEDIEKIGSYIGMAFQIQDDILDVTGDAAVIGKPVLSDEKNNKTTYVTLYGVDAAREAVAKYTNDAIDILNSLKSNGIVCETEFFEETLIMLVSRNK